MSGTHTGKGGLPLFTIALVLGVAAFFFLGKKTGSTSEATSAEKPTPFAIGSAPRNNEDQPGPFGFNPTTPESTPAPGFTGPDATSNNRLHPIAEMSVAQAMHEDVDFSTLSRSEWPKEVTLTKPVSFTIRHNGRVAGAVQLPVGTSVKVYSVSNASVKVVYQNSSQEIPIGNTDIEKRIQTRRADLR